MTFTFTSSVPSTITAAWRWWQFRLPVAPVRLVVLVLGTIVTRAWTLISRASAPISWAWTVLSTTALRRCIAPTIVAILTWPTFSANGAAILLSCWLMRLPGAIDGLIHFYFSRTELPGVILLCDVVVSALLRRHVVRCLFWGSVGELFSLSSLISTHSSFLTLKLYNLVTVNRLFTRNRSFYPYFLT